MLEIRGATAVITGAGSGIGRALAGYWAGRGGRVVLGDVDGDAAEAAAREIRGRGGDAIALRCDVTREADCAALADRAVDAYGGIHLVAPLAGIIRDGLLVSTDRQTGRVTGKMSVEDFRAVTDVNLTGVFLTVRECVHRMVDHGCRGLLCLMASVSAGGTAGQINYAAAKAAVAVMPRVLTAELMRRGVADRIRCVAVAPGFVDTPMVAGMDPRARARLLGEVPIGRMIAPEEVCSLIVELYRNEAVAGEVFFLTGGLRIGSRG